jgi:regulator of sigma E protease
VDDNANPIYEDLFFASLLAKPGSTEIYLKWQTPSGEVHDAYVTPVRGPGDPKPSLGVGFPVGLQIIRGIKDPAEVSDPDSPVARAAFELGDTLIGVRPQGAEKFSPLVSGWDLTQAEEKWRREPLEFQVQRGDQIFTVTVEPAYFWTTGFHVTMGPIRMVPEYSFAPASARQFREGDQIMAIDGDREFDPLRLPDLMRDQAEQGRDVTLTVQRKDQEVPIIIPHSDLAGRDTWNDIFLNDNNRLMNIPALGLAYEVIPRVSFIEPASPAEAAGLLRGDELASITYTTTKGTDKSTYDVAKKNWAQFFWALQTKDVKKQVTLTFRRNGVEKSATLNLRPDRTWPLPHRGFRLEWETNRLTADSFSQAIYLGFRETYRDIIRMYMSLKSVASGGVSPGMMSGPVGIAEMAYRTAEQGFTDFMFLMGFISINLAVVNFLPIPILDGGHMAFLLWEKIRGKPASERAMAIANTLGLAVILCLLCWVLFLDFGGRKFFFGN